MSEVDSGAAENATAKVNRVGNIRPGAPGLEEGKSARNTITTREPRALDGGHTP